MFYAPCQDEWFQGDILSDFPFIATDLSSRTSSTELFRKQALIITQTCDLQRRHFIQLCPIHNFDDLKKDLVDGGKSEKGAESFIDSIRNRTVNYYFYLKADAVLGIKEGYADLNFISTIPRTQLLTLNRITSLATYPRQVLAYQSGNLFLRPH